MAIDVRLTNAQALKVCELVGRVEVADYKTKAALGVNGIDERTLRNAATRMMVELLETLGDKTDGPHSGLFRLLLEQVRQGDHEHDA